MRAATLPDIVTRSVHTHTSRIAQRVDVAGEWHATSYEQLGQRITDLAGALIEAGLNPGDRIAICARNCPEWTLVDLGALHAGCVTVPIYTTSPLAQVRHVLNDSGARAVFVGSQQELATIAQVWGECPELELLVVLTGPPGTGQPRRLGLADLLARRQGRTHEAEIEARTAAMRPDDVVTLIYTPGTTGVAKGVMLTHANILSQIEAIETNFSLAAGDRSVSVLPLAHAYERVWSYMLVHFGMENVYVPDPREVADTLRRVQPQAFVSTPRLYHKIHDAAQRRVMATSGGAGRFEWALRMGVQVQAARMAGKRPSPSLLAQHALADRMVFRHVRDAVGGPKRLLSCGGAPLNPRVSELFYAAGLPIYHGYGQIETTAMTTCNTPADHTFDTVGRPVPGCQVRIAANGEILVRGHNVMAGYYGQPQASAAALENGWFHTGDMGYLTSVGHLVVTDRLVDLIVTAHGTTVAPQPLESALMAHAFVERAVIVGENRQYLTALIQPAFAAVARHAERQGWRFGSRTDLLTHPRVLGIFTRLITEVGADLDAHVRLRDFRLLEEELTQTRGDLSPTEGVRRTAVEARFADLIETMYPAARP